MKTDFLSCQISITELRWGKPPLCPLYKKRGINQQKEKTFGKQDGNT